jgi:hypothetical protein
MKLYASFLGFGIHPGGITGCFVKVRFIYLKKLVTFVALHRRGIFVSPVMGVYN